MLADHVILVGSKVVLAPQGLVPTKIILLKPARFPIEHAARFTEKLQDAQLDCNISPSLDNTPVLKLRLPPQ
jgi:hypothetical protein